MREEEKIAAGILFCPADPELREIKRRAHHLSLDFNKLYEEEHEKREEILHNLLGSIGEGTFLQGPITFHYGKHTNIGDHTFINFNFTVQDDALVSIGNHCNFGPNVTIVTPLHPMLPEERRAIADKDGVKKHFCYAKPVKIGSDCWFGANVTVCPGVTVGDGCVIGAGSVVTKDIPAGYFAAGVPCKVIRKLTEKDSMIYKPDVLADNKIIDSGKG